MHNPVLGGPNTQLAETATKYQYQVRNIYELHGLATASVLGAGGPPADATVFLAEFRWTSCRVRPSGPRSSARKSSTTPRSASIVQVRGSASGRPRSSPSSSTTPSGGIARLAHPRTSRPPSMPTSTPRRSTCRASATCCTRRSSASCSTTKEVREILSVRRHRAPARRRSWTPSPTRETSPFRRGWHGPDHPGDRAARLRLARRHRRRRGHPCQHRRHRPRRCPTSKRRSPGPSDLGAWLLTRLPAAIRRTRQSSPCWSCSTPPTPMS